MHRLKKGWRIVWTVLAIPVALLYGIFILLRNWLYDKGWLRVHRLPCTVVSIGNLTLGGSGKTPFALYLLQWLQERGIQAGYLSRGYGRSTRGYAEVSLEKPNPARLYGDEPCLVKSRLPTIPVAVAENRVLGGQKLLQTYPSLQVIVLDDAFQHRRIYRDIDILIIDVQHSLWKDWLFPLGRLREPLRSYRRAHLLIFNRKTRATSHKTRRFRRPVLEFEYQTTKLIPAHPSLPPLSIEALRNRNAISFCGIATPDSFHEALIKAGVYVLVRYDFPDHYFFKERHLATIRRQFRRFQKRMRIQNLLLLTTEKDLVRIRDTEAFAQLQDLPLYAVQIAMVPVKEAEAQKVFHTLFANLLSHDYARSL
ncbi:MAG: tetraacyldisaccharide 4'-kinase [Bacteroidia bacterium]|nr:tetraacyldisaccharide 4'-kinase [Bacteroidia bacterium]MDW8014405.1 tetraacyldisaccharide 4'-kinase [Bacteroidia bacterium]